MRIPEVEIFTDSVVGSSRSINKDRVIVVNGRSYIFACVMDGVSSASGALRAVDRAQEFIGRFHGEFLESTKPRLVELVGATNQEMVRSGEEPYSTFVGVVIKKDKAMPSLLVAIGDSRAYGISKQAFDQLTVDDVDPGRRNVITRYMGDPDLVVSGDDIRVVSSGYQALLLCSDGAHHAFEDDFARKLELHRVIMKFSKGKVSQGIRRRYLSNNLDDASYILLRWANV